MPFKKSKAVQFGQKKRKGEMMQLSYNLKKMKKVIKISLNHFFPMSYALNNQAYFTFLAFQLK